jgi:cytochrome c biogenesis protein CcmG/thiol:disulfide interchange protein DsbE
MPLSAQIVRRSVTFCFLAVACGCTQSDPSQVAKNPPAANEPAVEAASEEARPAVDSAVRPATAAAKIETVAEPAAEPNAPAEENAPESPGSEPAKLTTVKAIVPYGEVPDAELKMPLVSMTAGHAEACRVKVGDQFPDVELKDLSDQAQPLAKLRGKNMTVVVFWNGKKPLAREQLADLEPAILARFGASGVSIVGVNSGDDPQLAGELAKQAGASFPVMSDPQGTLLAQVAPGKVPSTYLLDSDGKILWFDIEYSRSTRRELVEAIRYKLAHN